MVITEPFPCKRCFTLVPQPCDTQGSITLGNKVLTLGDLTPVLLKLVIVHFVFALLSFFIFALLLSNQVWLIVYFCFTLFVPFCALMLCAQCPIFLSH